MNTVFYLMLGWLLIVLCRALVFAFRARTRRPNLHFTQEHLDNRAVYLQHFRGVPCSTYLGEVDIKAAFDYIRDEYRNEFLAVYQSINFNREEDQNEFTKTVFVLRNRVVIELARNYLDVVYPWRKAEFVNAMIDNLKVFREAEKEQDFEMNIITQTARGMELRRLEIKHTHLDIGLYYNEDFREVDELIRARLNTEKDKGLVLLHGLPGTGKTTYLRYLIGAVKKRVLFISPSVAANLANPDLIDVLLTNPNSILVIEDAENILMDRKVNENGAVSNLLNLTDGLLGDCLNVQIICTFNNALSMIDPALMRKGRLIARYEFRKLDAVKATALSRHLGFDQVFDHPATIAEITNQRERAFETKTESIGFRVGMANLQN